MNAITPEASANQLAFSFSDTPPARNGKVVKQRNFDLRTKPPVTLTQAQRRAINEQVREILNNGAAGDDDRDILYRFTGEGGLSAGTREALNQHFTDFETIRAIYRALDNAGFRYRKVLEPAAGSGNFVGMRPECDWTTVELDPVCHALLNRLYPDAKHYNISFEQFTAAGFDLVISNVPFSEERGAGSLDIRPDIRTLHDFYVVHALERVKENGLVVFITATGTMDKTDSAVREEITRQADVLAAFRLPEGHFRKNAHTDVTVDIIFLMKRPAGTEPREENRIINKAFRDVRREAKDLQINTCYDLFPDHVLGELSVGKGRMRYGKEVYVVKGVADLERIEIDYRPYPVKPDSDIEETETTEKLSWTSAEFREWVGETGAFTREYFEGSPLYHENVVISDGKVYELDREVVFTDYRNTAKVYRQVAGGIARKILALDRLRQMAERFQANPDDGIVKDAFSAIRGYGERFVLHPAKDKLLRQFFERNDELSLFLELGSFFNRDFEPSDVFREKTRHSDSGRIEVNGSSPLSERAFAAEDNKGVIAAGNRRHLLNSERFTLLDNGYALADIASGVPVLQNEILYFSGNVYRKTEKIDALLYGLEDRVDPEYAERCREKLAYQRARLDDIKPAPKTLDEIDFKSNESWIYPLVHNIVGIEKEVSDRTGQTSFLYSRSESYEKYLNNHVLVRRDSYRDRQGNTFKESMAHYLQRLRQAEDEVEEEKDRIRRRIRDTPGLAERVEYAYNSRFRGYVPPDYRQAAYLVQDVLDEIAAHSEIRLRRNQVEWMVRAAYEGKGINAHDVGGGKTFCAIALARVLKKRGIAKKPMFAVPAKTIEKWQREIRMIFPDARIINLGKLSRSRRTEKLWQVANSNADYILISHEGFGKIKLAKSDESHYIDQIVAEHIDDPEATGRQQGLLKARIDRYKRLLMWERRDHRLTFDKLGVDCLFVDEAHNFKNIAVRNELNRFGLGIGFGIQESSNGISLKSMRSYDYRFKANWIADHNNDSNNFQLTATPTPNKPMEIYTMLRHLSPRIFDEYGIHTDRDFSNTFFKLGTVENPASNNAKNILKAITNAPELRSIIDRFVDRRTIEQMPWITIPEARENRVFLNRSPEVEQIMADLQRRQGTLSKRFTGSTRGEDTTLAIYSTGRNGSVDPRLYYSPHAEVSIDTRTFDTEDDKVQYLVERVVAIHRENPAAGQLIFVDNSGHSQVAAGRMKENLHREIKRELVAAGFRRSEIAVINGKEVTNPATWRESSPGSEVDFRKLEISDLYNAGRIKVLIGTTQSMGEGMDLQVKTTDIWHLDIPYTPGAFRQRNGRGVRYGNENDHVNIHYLFMRGTFDSLSFEIVANKKGWNEAIWDKEVAQEISTVEEMAGGVIPQREQILIEMETDPEKKERMILHFELNRMYEQRARLRDGVFLFTGQKERTERYIDVLLETETERRNNLENLQPNGKIKNPEKRAEAFEKSKEHLERLLNSSGNALKDARERVAKFGQQAADARAELAEIDLRITGFVEKNSEKLGIREEETEEAEFA